MCHVCFRSSRLTQPPSSERCPGRPVRIEQLFHERKGHAVSCSDYTGGILVFCTKCGAISSGQRLFNLADTCKNSPQSGKAYTNLVRIQKLQHPDPKKGDAPILSRPVTLDSITSVT